MRESLIGILSVSSFLEEETDDLVIVRFFAGISALLLYLQYFSVILVDTIELGLFQDVFRFLKIFGILFNVDANVSEGAIIFGIVGLCVYPFLVVFIVKLFLRSTENSLSYGTTEKVLFRTLFGVLLLLIIIGISFVFVELGGATIVCFITAVYVFLLIIVTAGLKGITQKPALIQFLRGLLTFLYIPLGSFLANLIVLNLSSDLNEITTPAAFTLVFILSYIAIFEFQFVLVQRNGDLEKPRCVCCICCTCCFTCFYYTRREKNFIHEHIVSDIKSSRWWFHLAFLGERLTMAIVGGVYGSEESLQVFGETAETTPPMVFFFLLMVSIVFTILFRPYKIFSINLLEIFLRFSHFLLVGTILLLQQDIIQEITSQFLLFGIAIPTLIFMLYNLKPFKVWNALKRNQEDATGTLIDLQARLRWHNANSQRGVKKVIRAKKDKIMKAAEWEIMSMHQKIYALASIERDEHCRLTDERLYHIPTFNLEVVTYGLSCVSNIAVLDLSHGEVDDETFEAFEIEDILSDFFYLEEVILSNNHKFTLQGLDTFLNLLTSCTNLKALRMVQCRLSSYFAPTLAAFLSKCDLEVMDLSYNFLMSKGVSLILCALNQNGSVRVLRLQENLASEISQEALRNMKRFRHLRELMLCQNCLHTDSVVHMLHTLQDSSITTFGCSAQKSFTDFETVISEDGTLLVSEDEYLAFLFGRRTIERAYTSSIVVNEMIKVLRQAPYLKFSPMDNNILSSLVVEDNFEIEVGVIISVKPKLWLQLMKGYCCYFTTAVSVLNDLQRLQVNQIINDPSKDGRTIAEIVIMKGVSHVLETLQVLKALNANFTSKTRKGKQLIDILKLHTDSDIRSFAIHLEL